MKTTLAVELPGIASVRKFFYSCALLLCVLSAGAYGDDSNLRLELRIIKARDPITQPSEIRKATLDKNLLDLNERLSRLPFYSFVQVKKIERTLEMKQKIGFPLCSGQILIVRPLSREGDKIGLWLRWNDADGSPLIDTRMHIDANHPIIIGNEEGVRETGRVLALSLEKSHEP